MLKRTLLLSISLLSLLASLEAQQSVAHRWNEAVLDAIRDDFARPTVHARNLFHTSVAMYDAWAAYEPTADTYLLGKEVQGFTTPFKFASVPADVKAAQEEAMSYAAYRLILHRFQNAPFFFAIEIRTEYLMEELGYDINVVTTDYHCSPAGLGNYIAEQLIAFGKEDGSNEENDYANQSYQPVNPPLKIDDPGNPNIIDLNRWQPLELTEFIDQSGNPIGENIPDFLGPEWGAVWPFSLQEEDLTIYQRDGFDYKVYHDPGPPMYMSDMSGLEDPYKWGHTMVSVWSSHHNPADNTTVDISPAALGNIQSYPTDISEYPDFYNFFEGGDSGEGRAVNPATGLAYEPNVVKRSDYTRILAEFWADGPDSETPPGHWYTILNTVNEHPDLEKRFMGTGPVLDDLEWDVKSYFILGGAMHDVAITSWGIKGWYDYIRPVSAIRAMAELGQSSDPGLPSYHENGLPLIPGLVEIISSVDPLQGLSGQHIGKLKVFAWRGPDFIDYPEDEVAGVGWIRAKEWWPYQRPSFVTPPFAGYVSGHSTYSRAAAEVLTALTGDPFFPGGMGEFFCPKNEFLVFEDGPSEDITLQWATYRDASDQCSLSRIWGGIHPPVDDIPGRLIGEKIGLAAFELATTYFTKTTDDPPSSVVAVFPNPTACRVSIAYPYQGMLSAEIYQYDGKLVQQEAINFQSNQSQLALINQAVGVYILLLRNEAGEILLQEKITVLGE